MKLRFSIMLLCVSLTALLCGEHFFQSLHVQSDASYIKWVEFTIPSPILYRAIELDIQSRNEEERVDFIEVLSYLAAKNGGNFKKVTQADVAKAADFLKSNSPTDLKQFSYYLNAYGAVMNGWVGEYEAEQKSDDGTAKTVLKYGLIVRHPVKGYYSDSDDFGNNRSYGFQRKHQGHDFFTSTGVPVAAMEDGVIEVMGWNRYGGWRIGIRSFDGMRYYYYAHLRKDTPFAEGLAEGHTVKAGQTIGYVGQTGYSFKENVNNIQVPHLHFGIQLIFNEVQKDGNNQIWIDCYQIAKLLSNPPAPVIVETTVEP
ncbi:MAG: M23 family metallopeptidase [Clostridia bacterium]|nr:M23 family metallopeptidase [Clostridia bacterium]